MKWMQILWEVKDFTQLIERFLFLVQEKNHEEKWTNQWMRIINLRTLMNNLKHTIIRPYLQQNNLWKKSMVHWDNVTN